MGVMHHAASAALMVTPTPVVGHHRTGFVSAHSATAPLHSADSKLVKKKKKEAMPLWVCLSGVRLRKEREKKNRGHRSDISPLIDLWWKSAQCLNALSGASLPSFNIFDTRWTGGVMFLFSLGWIYFRGDFSFKVPFIPPREIFVFTGTPLIFLLRNTTNQWTKNNNNNGPSMDHCKNNIFSPLFSLPAKTDDFIGHPTWKGFWVGGGGVEPNSGWCCRH